jgi:probable phosphoglycerate mutase
MTPLALFRHGLTQWNIDGRLQGRINRPLCARGIAALQGRRFPAAFAGARVYVSPLARAIDTATLLGCRDVTIEPRLVEMDWGLYEGRTLPEIAASDGADFASNEARGLDFRPPGGESPRDVQARLAPWLRAIAEGAAPVLAITHKGVIRALLAQAFDWNMIGEAPFRIDWGAMQTLQIDDQGRPRLASCNLALERA